MPILRLRFRRAALALAILLAGLSGAVAPASAERIKDLANLAGVRNNQLIGYGIIVGLDGTGDQTTQAPFTGQSMINMLSQLGVQLPPGQTLQLKNVAAVVVTAVLPAFARPGQAIDVTVSSIGNAKSLRGGTLLMTPLKGADGQIYAVAQGNLLVGGAGAGGGGAKVQVNHLSAGRIANGATVERSVPTSVTEGEFAYYELQQSDFATAQRVADAINTSAGSPIAVPLDGRAIRVRMPADHAQRVGFLGQIDGIDVKPSTPMARVIINPRTGSVVMNQNVTLEPCAVAHGSLTVTVSNDASVSQPPPLSGGSTVVTNKTDVQLQQGSGSLLNVRAGASLAEVVKAINALGANPLDLLAILQAMKAAGALRADLEII
jgi:flagellar P-ring protein precursor FlgI